MCDMTQFVIDVPVLNETAATLVEHFMQHIFFKGLEFLILLF